MPKSTSESHGPARDRNTALYLFDPDSVSSGAKPPEDAARLIWLLLGLIRGATIGYERHLAQFGRSERTFRRDITKLRELGREFGFTISVNQRHIALQHIDGKPPKRVADGAARDALRGVAEALGRIVADSVSNLVEPGGASDRFLHFATPRVVDDSNLAHLYGALRGAWERNARVAFRFPDRRNGAPAERTVEPYFVNYHSGRYYLTGFDIRPRSGGWRQFPLDRIAGGVRPAGTFKPRPIAPGYARTEALGLFKTGKREHVTIELSHAIADATCARAWQEHQRVTKRGDGSATIVFEVFDLGEAVRWAFQFGIEAKVVAPERAVRMASDWAHAMSRAYAATEAAKTA